MEPIQPPAQPPVQPPTEQPVPPIQQAPQTPNTMSQTPITPPTPQTPPITQTPQVAQTPQAPQAPHRSQKKLFLALGLIILLFILGTVAYSIKRSSSGVNDVIVSPAATQKVKQTTTDNNSPLLPTGTNNVQLEKDLQTIDTKIGTAESEIGNVDQGLNDQSVNLIE